MLTLVAQKRHDECNIGCVLTVLSRFINVIDYMEVVKKIEGNSFYDMRKLLNSYNVKSCSYKITNSIKNIDFDICICQLRDLFSSHFIVLEKENNEIYYYDPSNFKRAKISRVLIKKLSGYILIIESKAIFKRPSIVLQVHYKTKILFFAVFLGIISILIISALNYVI